MREREIFIAALQRDDPKERRAYLEGACGADAGLWDRVQALLGAFDRAGSFLLEPAANLGATGAFAPSGGNGEEMVESSPLESPGTVIGPYTLREQIGEGGMGVVYVAEQAQPVRRKVALKIIKPGMDTQQVIARFEAERQALAMMDHPNIARVIDGGVSPPYEGGARGGSGGGRPYFVMELVRGIPITDYCDRERLSIPERLELFVLVCRAVQHAHQKGIIHRDLKPSNILLTVIDGAAVPKVIDFGVAKATGAALTERTIYSAFQQFIGTPLYMSPEQADLAGADVDTRSDIYSLGVLLYELLTGTTPFDQDTFRTAAFDEMRRIIREQEPPKPSTRLSSLGATRATVSANRMADARQLDRTVRGELDWIVMKALEKDRRRRYETANDFAADVMRYLTDQPVAAGPPSAGYRLRKFVRRNKGPVAAGLALAVLLVVGTVGTSIGLVRALRAERRATTAAERARTAEVLATNRLVEVTREKERATAAEAKAKEEKERATTAKANAKDAAEAAMSVVKFLQEDLLGQADPGENARDKKVTVEEVLGRAAARIEGRFAKEPVVEAWIRHTVGRTYDALSNYAAARPHLERAWELFRIHLGEENLNSLNVLNDLALLYMHQGQTQAAEPLLDTVLKVRRRLLGEKNDHTLGSMISLAAAYQSLGRDSEAKELLDKALRIGRPVLGEDDGTTLAAMNNLAMIYLAHRQYTDAEPLLAKVVEVSRRNQWIVTTGKGGPGLLLAMNNLSSVYLGMGDYLKAADLLERVLTISRQVRGEEHHLTLQVMNNLAATYWRAGRLDRSVPLLEEVVPKFLAHLGPEHPSTINAMADLGINYRDAGRLPEGIAALTRARELDRKRHGPQADPHDWLRITLNLAGAYWRAGRLDRSVPLFEEVVPKFLAHLGPEHPETIGAMADLGINYRDAGRLPEAISALARARELDRKRHGPQSDPHDWLQITRNLVEAYDRAGQFADSEPLYRETLEAERRHHGEASGEVAMALVNLAANLLNQRKYADAESLFREALATCRKRHEEASPGAAGAMAWLGLDLLKQQKYAEAEPFVRESLKIRERIAPDHWATFNTRSLLGGSLLGQEKYAEAEAMLKAGYEGMKQREATIPPGGKIRLTEATERLMQLYEAWGEPGKAAVWRARLGRTDLPADVFAGP
jgi:serine/threonine protein kinase/tetratricopeptide (TPR) repeat protein